MRGHLFLIIGFLAATACEDELARDTEAAAERVTRAADRLRHERRELAVEVAERADDIAVDPIRARARAAKHINDITDEVNDVTRKAAAFAEAQEDFMHLKSLRVQSLRLEHSVAASQPLLIQAIAQMKSLLPADRARLDENLVIFRQRLAETRDMIERLQFVTAVEWERHDDDVAHAMAALFIARDASWHAVGADPDADDDTQFPQT